jgi:crotonobetaine/carnitine-CoA ligase
LLDHLRRELPRHSLPRSLDFVDAIPKTPTQKIQRFKLTEHSLRIIDMKRFDYRH